MTRPIDDYTGDIHEGDAAAVANNLPASSVHTVVTSPPYWQQRDYDEPDQLGREPSPEAFVDNLADVFAAVRHALRPDGLAFIVIDDSYRDKSLCGVPSQLARALTDTGWNVVNRVVWAKPDGGSPDPASDRLAGAHETILVATPDTGPEPFIDHAANDWYGDVWHIQTARTSLDHSAVFPVDLPRRAIEVGTPPHVCAGCGEPFDVGYWPDDSLSPARIRSAVEGWFQTDAQNDLGYGGMEVTGDLSPLTPSVQQLRSYQAAVYGDRYRPSPVAGTEQAVEWFEETFTPEEPRIDLPDLARRLLGLGLSRVTDHPGCPCATTAAARPVVFDPFAGAGTTWVAAKETDRTFVGAELNGDYIEEARARVTDPSTETNRSTNQTGLDTFSDD